MHKHTHQLGYSLLESVIALAIFSALCLGMMQFQLKLLIYRQHIHHQQFAICVQTSLAERIKSCSSDSICETLEIERLNNKLQEASFSIELELRKNHHTFLSKLYFRNKKESIQLQFDHAF